ncbi:hypothetical protein IC232_08300 [Microvirga sp. BT688]|nr:hypothetical protein [Microvirga sp.]MBD2746698.1 hypothetical protein [Microvirga sp.]
MEDLPVEQLIPTPRIEALDEPVVPGFTWHKVCRLRSCSRNRFCDGFGNEMRAEARQNVLAQDEQIREHIIYIIGVELLALAMYSCVNTLFSSSIRHFLPSWVRSSTKS